MKPKVTCLCPTFGRFQLLRYSLSCFLHQTYENKELIILNDAPVPIECYFPQVTVINSDDRFPNLGKKRQELLEVADSPYVAQWDDDDVYLPWHLEEAMNNIHEGLMVKPEEAFYIRGELERTLRWEGVERNWFEAMTVFDREEAMDLGGYTDEVSGQTIRMIKRFKDKDSYVEYNPFPAPSFVFRFGDGHFHIQGGREPEHERFAKLNRDFGEEPLRPRKLRDYYDIIAERGTEYADNLKLFQTLMDRWLDQPMP